MTADELIAEGELLVKRCFALSARGSGTPAGYWGGSRADLPDQFPPEVTQFKHRRHIVSVGEPLLAQIGADRIKWVSLYEWTPTADDRDPLHHVEEDNDERATVRHDRLGRLELLPRAARHPDRLD